MDELRRQLAGNYVFRQYMTDSEIARLQCSSPTDFTDFVVASLIIGCVRLDAVLFQSNAGLRLGYDVFVKDDPSSPEWICYDSPSVPVSINESDMFAVLDEVVRSNGLSYTKCSFERIDGKVIKPDSKKTEVNKNV